MGEIFELLGLKNEKERQAKAVSMRIEHREFLISQRTHKIPVHLAEFFFFLGRFEIIRAIVAFLDAVILADEIIILQQEIDCIRKEREHE